MKTDSNVSNMDRFVVDDHPLLEVLETLKGKTIRGYKLLYREPIKGCHQSEKIVLKFSDDTTLAIETGSNLSEWNRITKPEDVKIDFKMSWTDD